MNNTTNVHNLHHNNVMARVQNYQSCVVENKIVDYYFIGFSFNTISKMNQEIL